MAKMVEYLCRYADKVLKIEAENEEAAKIVAAGFFKVKTSQIIVSESLNKNNIITKIESWQLQVKLTEEGAWNGKISVELDRDDLRIITDALSSAEMEGRISTSEMMYMYDKLNIERPY